VYALAILICMYYLRAEYYQFEACVQRVKQSYYGIPNTPTYEPGTASYYQLIAASLWEHFRFFQNAIDFLAILSVMWMPAFFIFDSPWAPAVAAMGTVINMPRMASMTRGSQQISFLIMMIQEIFIDMSAFLSIVTASLIVFCFSFMLLDETYEGNYAVFSRAWFTSYVMLLGEIDSEEWHEAFFLQAFLFHVFTVFSNIVLLNVLIAIISDTYERVQESARPRGLMARGRLLLEFQDMMTDSQLRNKKWFPKWIHAIQRLEDLDDAEGPWYGRVVAMKRQVHQEVELTRQTVRLEVKNVREEFKSEVGSLDKKLSSLQQLMLILSNKMDGVQMAVNEHGHVVEDVVADPNKRVGPGKPGHKRVGSFMDLVKSASSSHVSANLAAGRASGAGARKTDGAGAAGAEPEVAADKPSAAAGMGGGDDKPAAKEEHGPVHHKPVHLNQLIKASLKDVDKAAGKAPAPPDPLPEPVPTPKPAESPPPKAKAGRGLRGITRPNKKSSPAGGACDA